MTRRRWWLTLGVTLLIGLAEFVWFRYLEPFHRHTVWRQRVLAELRSLQEKRPADVSPERWECLSSWALNLHANCGYSPDLDPEAHFDPLWRDAFAAELERRVSGRVSVTDIDWIWDEYFTHTPNGRKYSDTWRPTREGSDCTCPR